MAVVGRVLTVECPCTGTPHPDGDTVTFRAVLPLAGGMAGISAFVAASRAAGGKLDNLILSEWIGPIYLLHAVATWTFTNADGAAVPISDGDAVLPFAVKYEIADAADDLFGEELTRPLAAMIRRSSGNGQTASSISRNRPSGRTPRRPSAPSSPTVSAASELSIV